MPSAAEELHSTLVERIDAHDRAGAVNVALGTVRSGALDIPQLHDMLAGLLADIGASWKAGETRVWQEHYATAVIRTIVEACHPLVAEHAAAPVDRTVVLATPPEEYHDLGLRMIADRFALAGWTAHLLGACLPLAELLAAVDELRADAVVLSAYTHFHRLALRLYVDELMAARPALQVWVGGAAFAREHDGWTDEMVLDIATIPALAGKVS
ncbi:MAG: cobalamin-dependent protein [Coriobacteriia bacterium]|nr:cobalamin-dependent protein [Coriobacteriia bacterium]